MTQQATPRPWTTGIIEDGFGRDVYLWIGVGPDQRNSVATIGLIGVRKESVRRREKDQNARLIASLPDLLAALQRLLAPMASWGGCSYCAPGFGDQWHDLDCPVALARAAIAKATGSARTEVTS